MKRIYLDCAATTPIDPRVLKTMTPYLRSVFGNPSSLHYEGIQAKNAIEQARQKVAQLIAAKPEEIIFTSGGTESNNFALKGIFYQFPRGEYQIITSSIEHHAILEPCKFLESLGCKVIYLPVDKDGLVDPEDVKKNLTSQTILVSIMHANNEMGTIQPIAEIADIIRNFRNSNQIPSASWRTKFPLFHTDAVQTAGHLPINVNELGVDLLSMSAHKLYGPKGVGALYIKKGVKIKPFMHGGEQENNLRASTENVPSIVGFGKAAELAKENLEKEIKYLTGLRDDLINQLLSKIKNSRLNGHSVKRLPNNVNVSIEGIEGEAMLVSLDLKGIACSTGSACSSNILKPSHVMMALGLEPEIAHGSLRFTLGRFTRKSEIDLTVKILLPIIERLRKISPLY
ncbi:MAG: cysteine desulfurase family protein [Patescibacteria group bacterium]|jgi:cysteine desulfurase